MKIGVIEAQTRLSNLLDLAERGEVVTITRHGLPVARLVATGENGQSNPSETFQALKTLRKDVTLGGFFWKDLRDTGRR